LNPLLNPLSGDLFRESCDHVFWSNQHPSEHSGFSHGQVIFCKIDEVWRLFRALRRKRHRIVLVTGEGDLPVDPALWKQKPPQVAAWFGTNMFVDHPTAHPIPLGLGNASCSITLKAREILQAWGNPPPRTNLLYANFSPRTNPSVRQPLLDWIESNSTDWIISEAARPGEGQGAYLRQLMASRLVLCPPGNGEDTHRLWEALYCGAIPVVRNSPSMRAFHGLPILFLSELCPLKKDMLSTTQPIDEVDSAVKLSPILNGKWWTDQIQQCAASLARRPPLSAINFARAWLAEGFRMLRTS